jgi:hypothetical protein
MNLLRLLKVASCVLALVLASLASVARAQVSTASIVGTIVDSSGAAVSGATVTATQVDMQLSRTATSGSEGAFTIPLLPLGPYSVKVAASGFEVFQQTGIVLTVGQVANIPITLRPGNVSQTVTVAADATMLNTTGSDTVQLIGQEPVEALPLNGRNPATLLYLIGGVSNPMLNGGGGGASALLQTGLVYPSESTAAIHGVRSGGVYFSLDGANNVDPYQVTGGPFPNPDMTSEINVVTGNYGARYISAPAGAVNIVTKSGTNQIHGNVFEFVRNGDVNAGSFFSSTATKGPVADPLKRNQFGADLGAPILHDRLFVFGGYQGTRLSDNACCITYSVPNAQERTGNLSQYYAANSIINPATGTPFAGNQVGPLDPTMQKLLAYVPLPANPTVNDNFSFPIPTFNTEQSYVVKSDFVHGSHRIFGRYFYDLYNSPPTGIPNNDILASQPGQIHHWHNATGGDTWVHGNFVSDARFSFIRDESDEVSGESTVSLPGLGEPNVSVPQRPSIQALYVEPYFYITSGNYNGFSRNSYDGAEDIQLLRGRNQFSLGAEVQKIGASELSNNLSNAGMIFAPVFTGNGLADYLIGRPYEVIQADGLYMQSSGWLTGYYGEDKIRFNNRFTVTAGLRWDPYVPFFALKGRMQCYIPGEKSTVYPNAPTGLVFAGDHNCNASGTNANNLGNVEPRIGFAYEADSSGKTVLRGGYGIYTMQYPMATFFAYGAVQPFERRFTLIPPGPVSNLYANFPGGNPFANGFQLGGPNPPSTATFINPQTLYNLAQNFKLGYLQQFSLVVERSLTANDFVSVGYYGSLGRHLSLVQDENQPVYIPGSSTTTNTQARRPNQNFQQAFTGVPTGMSNYNGLELVYRHRVRGGLTLSADFDWSKSMDDNSNPANDILTGALIPIPDDPGFRYAPSDFNQPHTLRAQGVWDLPWFARSTGAERAALAGWKFSSLFVWDAGQPFSVSSPYGQSFTGNGTDLADRVPNVSPNLSSGRSEQAKIAEYFNTAAFTVNAPGTFGNSGRNILTSPDYVDVDSSVTKDFQIRERWKINLRVDGFNVLNHTQFSPPLSQLGTTDGHITGSRAPRILQGAIKVAF